MRRRVAVLLEILGGWAFTVGGALFDGAHRLSPNVEAQLSAEAADRILLNVLARLDLGPVQQQVLGVDLAAGVDAADFLRFRDELLVSEKLLTDRELADLREAWYRDHAIGGARSTKVSA